MFSKHNFLKENWLGTIPSLPGAARLLECTLAALLLLFCSCNALCTQEEQTQKNDHRLKDATESVKIKTKLYEVDFGYPKFISGASKLQLDALNKRIRKDVMKVANDWRSGVSKEPPLEGLVQSLSGDSQVWLATPEYVSIQLTLSSCTGGPHPNNFGVPLNYGLSPLREIKITDLLPAKNSLKVLSEVSRKILYDMEVSTKDVIDEGTRPLASNFDNFMFDTKELQIIFQEYQVGPYLAGMPAAIMSYDDELKSLVPHSLIIQQILRSDRRFRQNDSRSQREDHTEL